MILYLQCLPLLFDNMSIVLSHLLLPLVSMQLHFSLAPFTGRLKVDWISPSPMDAGHSKVLNDGRKDEL